MENKESYIDYYLSRDISKLATDCKQSLYKLLSYLQNIDDSNFDDWDIRDLEADKTRVKKMIKEIHDNFGDDNYGGEIIG